MTAKLLRHTAAVTTASITVRQLVIDGRKLTLSVFRQIPLRPCWVVDPDTVTFEGTLWGTVNYWWGDRRGDWHVVHEVDGVLYRDEFREKGGVAKTVKQMEEWRSRYEENGRLLADVGHWLLTADDETPGQGCRVSFRDDRYASTIRVRDLSGPREISPLHLGNLDLNSWDRRNEEHREAALKELSELKAENERFARESGCLDHDWAAFADAWENQVVDVIRDAPQLYIAV